MHSTTHVNPESVISRLFVVGINYRNATVKERSLFSLSEQNQREILHSAKEREIRSVVILSTCNRTELYAFCNSADQLIELLVQHSKGNIEVFKNIGFMKRGHEALKHLFHVASGLDSQIVGDNEVLGQLKTAIAFSRGQQLIGPLMDRTLNFVFQASKSIRTNTKLSSGSVSVAYAAITWMKNIPQISSKKILLFGIGKFGTTLAKNIKQHYPLSPVTVINRTDSAAIELASLLDLTWKSFSELPSEIKQADIIIVCTNAAEYTLLPHFFSGEKNKWILDLSVPENTDPEIKKNAFITVAGIDEVSMSLELTLNNRKQEIPKALSIINQYQNEFYEWLKLQKHVPLINEMKSKLFTLGETHFCSLNNNQDSLIELTDRVNQTVGSLAMKLRSKNEKGCQYISAINEFLEKGTGND